MRRKAERGHVAGGIVYGYRNVRHGDHTEREIEPAQAEVIRRIFREIARGDGFTRITNRLNGDGVRAPRPTRRGWATSGVREIVLREPYWGRIVYGKTRWEDHGGTKRKVDTAPAEWITVEAPHLRIVDEALWTQAHARLADTRSTYARLTNGRLIGRPGSTLESQYLLTGFLECGLCGGSVYVSKQNTQGGELIRYYLCATQRTRGTCPGGGIRIRMESLDAAVLDEIEAAVLTPARLTSLVERVAARLSAAAAQAPGREAASSASSERRRLAWGATWPRSAKGLR